MTRTYIYLFVFSGCSGQLAPLFVVLYLAQEVDDVGDYSRCR